MAYATTTDLESYLNVTASELPDDADRLLDRASELVDYIVSPNIIDTTDTGQSTAAQNAVCAQVEYWINQGEEVDIMKAPGEYSIGSFSVGRQSNQHEVPALSPRARRFLLLDGLLYKGVGGT